MRDQTFEPSARLASLTLLFLTVSAAFLRLTNLSAQGLWFDEAATWSQVSDGFLQMLSQTISDNYPPLYNTITWLFVQAFGEADWVLRLPAALFGIALVPMTYLLGDKAAGRATGLLAALLVVLSSFHFWYSGEARMYSLLALTACAYAWAALRYIEAPERGNWWLLLGCGFPLLMSHPYGSLDWIAVSSVLLLIADGRKRLIGVYALTWALFLPFALALLVHAYEITDAGFWIPVPTPAFVVGQLMNLTSSLLPLLLAGAIAACIPRRDLPSTPALGILVALVAVPPLLAYVASLLTRPVFLDRYLIGSLPALFVLAAAGITRWLTGRWLAMGAVALAIAGAATFVYVPKPPRPDWRSAVAYADQVTQPEDCVLVRPNFNARTWRYYSRTNHCLERSVEDALNRPSVRNLIYIAENEAGDQAAFDMLGKQMDLLATHPYRGVTVYEFGRKSDQ